MWIWQFDSATLLQPRDRIESYKTYVELQGKRVNLGCWANKFPCIGIQSNKRT